MTTNLNSKLNFEKKEKVNLNKQRDIDREKVRGIFRFHEVPGGVMDFVYKAYRGDEVERFTMHDGEIYTIPLGVAKHLNKNLSYPVHSYAQDENGKSIVKIGQRVKRCSFQSLEFMDIEDLSDGPSLITVEATGL